MSDQVISYPYAAPEETYIRQAMLDSREITFGNKDRAEGSAEELNRAKAFAVVAEAIAAGDTREALVQRFAESVRKMLTLPEYMPNYMGGLDSRGHCSMPYGIALLWNRREIRALFSERETEKLLTMFRAMLVSVVYTLNDYDGNGHSRPPQRLAMNGDDNMWNGSGVNFWEPNLVILNSALIVLGRGAVTEFLRAYDHLSFIEELGRQGLTSIRQCFARTARFSDAAAPEERLREKARYIEKIVKGPWKFKEVTMETYLDNPMLLYAATQEVDWDRAAQDGDYIGCLGMAHEFDCYDNFGTRQNNGYVMLGIDPILQNRVLMHYLGVWELPKNRALRARIERLHRVGVSDYYAKIINGYFSESMWGTKKEYFMNCIYVMEQFRSMGLADEALFHDAFLYEQAAQAREAEWNMEGGSFSMRQDTIVPYNIKYYFTNAQGAELTDPGDRVLEVSSGGGEALAYTKCRFGDMKYLVWMKDETDGTFGLAGRVQDRENFYLLCVRGDTAAVRLCFGGNMTTLAETKLARFRRTASRLKGVFCGNRIEFHLDGQKILSCIDDTFAEGAAGVYAENGTAKFDAVLVQRLNDREKAGAGEAAEGGNDA